MAGVGVVLGVACGIVRSGAAKMLSGVRGQRLALFGTLVFAFLAAVALQPSSAAADTAQQVVHDHIGAISKSVARGGVVDVPGVDCDADSDCDPLWQQMEAVNHQEHGDPGAAQSLAYEQFALLSRVRVLPDIPPGAAIALTAGGVVVGAQYLAFQQATRVHVVEIHTPLSHWTSPPQQRLTLTNANEPLYTGLSTPTYQSWVWGWSFDSGYSWRNFWVTPVEAGNGDPYFGCNQTINPPGVPEAMTQIDGLPHPNCGSYSVCQAQPGCNGGEAHAAVITTRDLLAGTFEDYDSQSPIGLTISASPLNPPSSASELESRTLDLLDTSDFATLQEWYAHHFSPRCHADPLNPGATEVPEPAAGETAAHYAECLGSLGVEYHIVRLSYADADLEHAPGEIVSIDPAPGTGASGHTVTVTTNPVVDGLLEDTANALKDNNPQASLDSQLDVDGNATVAETIAMTCLKITAMTAALPSADQIDDSDCGTGPSAPPIFVTGFGYPSTGSSQLEATKHVQSAFGISQDPAYPNVGSWIGWARETYENKTRTEWYKTENETGKSNSLCSGDADAVPRTGCNEVPFALTFEGGQKTPPATGRTPHLRIINQSHNGSQGSVWNTFLNRCNLKTQGASNPSGGAFLMVPNDRLPTMTNICNGNEYTGP